MNLESLMLAGDTVNVQSGGKSFFEKLGDAATAGVAGSVISGLGSIYNTGAYASNKLFGTSIDEIDTGKVLGQIDSNWQQYYEDNKSVIDTVGFIGGSFVPGALAVKALNLARTGQGVGTVGRALGFTINRQQSYLEAGLQQIAQEGTSVFSTINKNKTLGMLYGAADTVLQTAVFETAAALTMARSPVLADESWADISWDITKSALVGGGIGVIGGAVKALWTNKIFRDTGKLVDSKARIYDTLSNLDNSNLSFGDKAFSIIDEAFKLPDAVFDADRKLQFHYRLNGKNTEVLLDTGALLDRKLSDTVRKAEEQFKAKLTNAIAADTSVGEPFSAAMFDIIQQGKAAKAPISEIRQKLLDYLGNLKQITSVANVETQFLDPVRYLVPGATLTRAGTGTSTLFSTARTSSRDIGYRIVGDESAAKFGILGVDGVGVTLRDAWERGFDVVINGAGGKVHVNPASAIFRRTEASEDVIRTTFNTRTKQVVDEPIVTLADMATTKSPLNINETGVSAGNYTFQFSSGNHHPTLDSVYNTARNVWASQVTNLAGQTISSRDFALLDRIVLGDVKKFEGTLVKAEDGVLQDMSALGNFREYVLQQKVAALQDAQRAAGAEAVDTRQLAYMLNTEQSWVEDAIGKQLNVKKLDTDAAFRRAEDYKARENIVLIYDKPPIADPSIPDFPDGYVDYQSRVKLAQQAHETASSAVLGEFGERFMDIKPDQLGKRYDATGSGASGFGASNANYDDPARLWAQDSGRAVHLTIQDFVNRSLETIRSSANKITTTGNKELGAVVTKVRNSQESLTLWNGRLVDLASRQKMAAMEEKLLDPALDAAKRAKLQKQVDEVTFKVNQELNPETYEFLTAYHNTHKDWLGKTRILAASQGRTLDWNPEALYVPPIDTKKVPYFAFVRATEGRIASSSEVAMITAKTPDELQTLAAAVRRDHPDLQVIFKADTEDYFRARGDYDYSSGLNAPSIDPMLRKQGKLADFLPVLEPKAVIEDFVNYISKRDSQLVRNTVQVKYAQTFTELQFLSRQYTKLENSKFQYLGRQETKKVTDPFGDYMRTALDISKRAEFTLWHNLNEFVDAVGTRAYGLVEESWRQARMGKEDWIDANKQLEKMGLRGAFSSQENYLQAQTGADKNLIKIGVAKANMLLANVALRLDTANALVNVISTPVLLGAEVQSIRSSLAKSPELLAQFNGQLTESIPGMAQRIPSTMRLVYNAVKNYWGPDKAALLERYEKTIGSIRNDNSKFHDMIQDLALTPNLSPKEWTKKVDKAVEIGATWTGNNLAEQFTRFVASDVMRQITHPVVVAGKMTEKEQNAMIAVFVNRTQGNYISSQRPIAFQGTLGAAVGLFQTYMFNMFQQVFRHIENRDAKSIAVAGALQSTIFGLNGLPMFDAINTHVIGMANINEGHRDVYSSLAAVNKEAADTALYGLASAFPFVTDKAPALYTRGDLNPRHVSILPTSFDQIPAIEATSRIARAVWGIGNSVANGSTLGDAMLHGLEHNGVSRPLAGLVQALSGRTTQADGSIISAHNDLLSIGNAARIIGAKPMDESVAMNHRFRLVAYQAADKERIEKLGSVVKEKIRAGTLDEEDIHDFAGRYAAAGGRVQSYSAALQRWTRAANESEVNTIMRAQGTWRGQRMLEVMGADPLPDYVNLND